MKLLPRYLEYFISPITGKSGSAAQLPDLTEDHIWVGDADNHPVETTNYLKYSGTTSVISNFPMFTDSLGHEVTDSGFGSAELKALADAAAASAAEAAASAAAAGASAAEAQSAAAAAGISAGEASGAALTAAASAKEADGAATSAIAASLAALKSATDADDAADRAAEDADAAYARSQEAAASATAAAASATAAAGSASAAATSATNAATSAASALLSKTTCEQILNELYSTGINIVGDISASGAINSPIVAILNLTLDAIPLAAQNVNLNSKKIINLANGTAANDAVNYGQLTGAVFGAVSQKIYVSNRCGSDVTGNGCINSPYETISYALSQITTAGVGSPFCISLECGTYSETSGTLRLKPNISILGNGSTLELGSVNLDASFSTATSYLFIKNIIFRNPFVGSAIFSFSLTSKTLGRAVFEFEDMHCVTNNFSFTASGNPAAPALFFVAMRNCFIDERSNVLYTKTFTLTNFDFRIENCNIDVLSIENSSGTAFGDTNGSIYGCNIATSLTLKASGAQNLNTKISNMPSMPPTWTIDGANSIVTMYSPFDVSPTLINSATFNPTSQFKNIKATATTASVSALTGALISSGGLGVAGSAFFGGPVNATDTTNSTSTSTGSFICNGGAGIGNDCWIGGLINAAGIIKTTNGTNSTSISTGALVSSGGLGVAGQFYLGGLLVATNTLDADSLGNGSIISLGGIYAAKKGYFASTVDATGTGAAALMTAGGLGVAKAAYIGGILHVTDTTASTSIVSGSGIFGGGLGVAGKGYFGGALNVTDTTQSTSTTTGSIIGLGGLAIGKDAYFGGQINTPSIAFTSTSGIIGTTTNNNAAAGSVGEYVSGSATSVSLSNGTAKNITSISLTAGDWDVYGAAQISNSGTMTVIAASISTTTGTLNSSSTAFSQLNISGGFVSGGLQAIPAGYTRISIASTTTVYLVGQANFSSGTTSANGYMMARRVR